MSTREYYERYWSREGYHPTGNLAPELEELFVAHVRRDAVCLDVGCGDGRTSGLWLREHAARYVGVDISENAVEQAAAIGLEAEMIRDAADLPFPDASFDVVVCIEVLEHLFQPFDAAVEMRRVLRPGGLLLATVPNVAYWRRRAELAAFGRWNPFGDDLSTKKPWRDPHIRFFSPRTLRAMLREAGFDPIETSGHGGGFLREVPGARRVFRGVSPIYRAAERRVPSLLSTRVRVVAVRS